MQQNELRNYKKRSRAFQYLVKPSLVGNKNAQFSCRYGLCPQGKTSKFLPSVSTFSYHHLMLFCIN